MTKKGTSPIYFSIMLLVLLVVFSHCQSNTYREGERLYKANCANCHMDTGEGLGTLIPPLARADYLEKNRKKLPCIIKHGVRDSLLVNGKWYAEQMAGLPSLSDIHITNVLNYINQSWGNDNEPYKLEEVRASLEKCQ